MKRFKIFLPVLAVFAFVGVALAQVISDPCSIYPHQSAFIPAQTATVKVVAGVVGKQIYICSAQVTQLSGGTTSATPGLSLWYGTQAAGTPCATATGSISVVTELAVLGAQGVTTYGGDGSHTILGPVPGAAASITNMDLCGLEAGAGTVFQGASLSYVQIVP